MSQKVTVITYIDETKESIVAVLRNDQSLKNVTSVIRTFINQEWDVHKDSVITFLRVGGDEISYNLLPVIDGEDDDYVFTIHETNLD